MHDAIALVEQYGAQHYERFPVVFVRSDRIYLWDSDDNRYIDAMAAYSAANHGHCHNRIRKVHHEAADDPILISNSYYHPWLGVLEKKLVDITGQDRALLMNTGAEAVETALKACRKWGYTKKGIDPNCAETIVADGNFHGRTIGASGFSSKESYRKLFGPFAPGTRWVPYGDHNALEVAITKNTVMFLVEPIQGEGGIRIPPKGYLTACAQICKKHNILLVVDEIQTGLGRTGKLFACHFDSIKPDIILLGKSLGGGSGIPVSAAVGSNDTIGAFKPGEHGSTFGGTALPCRIAIEAIDIILEENFAERADKLGTYFLAELKKIRSSYIKEVRGRGLFVGIEIDLEKISSHDMCLRLLNEKVVTKDANGVIRLTPPLIIEREEIDDLVACVARALEAKGY